MLFDPQRRHATPSGQRSSSSALRHSLSVSKSTFKVDREFFALMVMGVMPKRKPAHQLTGHELAHRVFGKSGHKSLQDLVLALDNKTKRKPPTKKANP
jgi:hypothetical protein